MITNKGGIMTNNGSEYDYLRSCAYRAYSLCSVYQIDQQQVFTEYFYKEQTSS